MTENRKIAVVENEQEARLLVALNKVCVQNERLRAVLQQIADDPDMDIIAVHIAKNALAQTHK